MCQKASNQTLPATERRAVRLEIDPRLSIVATHWYVPSSGLLCLEWTTWLKNSEPSGSMCRLSSETRLMKVPSFFHSMRAAVAASLWAEQLSSAELPRMASVSWGSTVNQKGLKGCAAEPKGGEHRGERGDLSWMLYTDTMSCLIMGPLRLERGVNQMRFLLLSTTDLFYGHCN